MPYVRAVKIDNLEKHKHFLFVVQFWTPFTAFVERLYTSRSIHKTHTHSHIAPSYHFMIFYFCFMIFILILFEFEKHFFAVLALLSYFFMFYLSVSVIYADAFIHPSCVRYQNYSPNEIKTKKNRKTIYCIYDHYDFRLDWPKETGTNTKKKDKHSDVFLSKRNSLFFLNFPCT